MPARTEPPFRADHVGSLLRPPALLAARAEHAAGRLDDAGLRAAEDAAIREAVAAQERIGLRAATDGEFRRTSWHMDFIYRLGGISRTDERIRVHMHNAAGDNDFTTAGLAVDGRIRLDEPIFADDFRFLADTVTTAVPKLTIPSPSMVHYRGGSTAVDRGVYPDLERVLGRPVRRLRRAGARDGRPGLHATCSSTTPRWPTSTTRPSAPSWPPAAATPTPSTCATSARSTPRWPGGRPASGSPRTCAGATSAPAGPRPGGYDYVAEALFGELDVDGFFCEFDDERSGGFAPLRFVPPGKQVVLGLVTTKTGELEDPDALKRRIDEAAKYVPLDQLCLSPQCGFSSTVEGNALTVEEQEAKLRLIVEVAADVWGD